MVPHGNHRHRGSHRLHDAVLLDRRLALVRILLARAEDLYSGLKTAQATLFDQQIADFFSLWRNRVRRFVHQSVRRTEQVHFKVCVIGSTQCGQMME